MYPPEKILSVLLPSYRALPSVARAIQSVLCEFPVEVVVAPDDGTTDYQFLEAQYPGVVKVLAPSLQAGPGAARNRAFAASSGQFITMLDADDDFAPGAVKEALALVQRSPQQVVFFRTAYVQADGGTVREMNRQQALSFQDFNAFQGSVHALYGRRHWLPYTSLLSEDVLHDANLLLRAGGQAPMTTAPYRLYLNPLGLCSNLAQDQLNLAYQQIRDKATDPQIKSLYQAKLDMGQAYAQALLSGADESFHSFVMKASIPHDQAAQTNRTIYAGTTGKGAFLKPGFSENSY
jgi:glycosyltransferase involved in cell wall biosynthesis